MTTPITDQLTGLDVARNVEIFPALRRRRQIQSNIWFFDSPKNNERVTISTDLAFMHLVLLEGDTSVSKYVPNPPPGVGERVPGEKQQRVYAHVYRIDGTREYWDFKRLLPARGRPKHEAHLGDADIELAARAAGASYHVKTDRDLSGKEVLFDNWLMLCAAITRCRTVFLGREADILTQRMALQRAVTVENLLTIPGIDVGCMLASIALSLQCDSIRANLKAQLFGRATLLARVES